MTKTKIKTTPLEALTTLKSELGTFNFIIGNKAPVDSFNDQLANVETALKNYNESLISTRYSDLLAMDKVMMFNDFIDNRFIELQKLVKDEKSNTYDLIATQKQLSFVELEKTSKKEICKGIYEKLTSLFMDNLYQNIKEDLTVKCIEVKASPSLNAEYSKLRDEYSFTNTSVVAMEKQLNTILTFLLPEELEIKAVKADVKYLQYALTKVKGGTLSIMQEKTFINEMFSMLYFRKNNIAYQFQTKMTAHKTV